MPSTVEEEVEQPLEIAVIGGGIIGLVVALGLISRKVKATIYEQARSLREIGAGVAFTANAIQCMNLLDPNIVAALRSVATSNGDPDNPNDWLQWVDGYNQLSEDPKEEKLLFKLHVGYRGFEGCHRAHFLDALLRYIPEGVIQFQKRLDTVSDSAGDGKVQLQFCDGTSAEADAGKDWFPQHLDNRSKKFGDIVIGCDGIKSRVRQVLLGKGNPASYPHYTHKVAYRGLIPMHEAISALGEYKAKNQHMHIGPKAHVLHFPVAGQTLVNFVAFASDPDEWNDSEKMVAPATRRDVEDVFANWNPTVRTLTSLLPEQLDKWAIFDSFDYPAPYYAYGRICVAGDAAHAAAPHHGAGAGIGVEDALCLSTLIEKAVVACQENRAPRSKVLSAALNTFDTVRRERSQWLVNSSRGVCDVYEWADPKTGDDPEKCFEEIKWRSHKIWYFDYKGMLVEALEDFERRLETIESTKA
jgi:salicylate hydroxylase